MPTYIKIPVFTFDQLENRAKNAALDHFREVIGSDDWHDAVYEDFQEVCNCLGITIAMSQQKTRRGTYILDPKIYFSGFSSQGDGASFEGVYRYKKGALKAIREYAPQDTTLHHIATELQALQKRNMYQLVGRITQSGSYCHEYTMRFEVERQTETRHQPTEDAEETIKNAMRSLVRWLYKSLSETYFDITSDQSVETDIMERDVKFTRTGKPISLLAAEVG